MKRGELRRLAFELNEMSIEEIMDRLEHLYWKGYKDGYENGSKCGYENIDESILSGWASKFD